MLLTVPPFTLKITFVPDIATSAPALVGNANGDESPDIVPIVTVFEDNESPVFWIFVDIYSFVVFLKTC